MTPRIAANALIGASSLMLAACSSNAPMAPLGLGKHPANTPADIAELTASRTVTPGPATSTTGLTSSSTSPAKTTYEEVRGQAKVYVETKAITDFTFSDFSAPGGFLAIEPQTRETVVSLAQSASSVRILCRTDKKRPSKAAYLAALRRGAAVRRYLIAQGVQADKVRIFVKSTGSFIADNSTKVGKAKNRRVEIKFS